MPSSKKRTTKNKTGTRRIKHPKKGGNQMSMLEQSPASYEESLRMQRQIDERMRKENSWFCTIA